MSSSTSTGATRVFKHLDIITAAFVTTLIASNLLSSAKIVDTGFSVLGLDLIFDGGLVIFPFCYIFADILTEVYGFRKSRRVIWIGFMASVFVVLTVSILNLLPGEANWLRAGGEVSYGLILFGLYSGVLTLASLSAYLVGEFVNSIALAKLKLWAEGKYISLRFILSTIFGQFCDTVIFILIATIGGVFPLEIFWPLFLTNYLFKVLIEVFMLPISIRFSSFLKKIEQVDAFDRGVSLNPFSLS